MSAKILCLDIERQSGLVDGVWEGKQWGSWIAPNRLIEPPRTICFAYRWLHWKPDARTKFVAEWQGNLPQDNTSYTPGGGHRAMIEKAAELFDEADYVVGWNSKGFDVKHLRAAFWYYGILPPSPHVDIDLMLQLKRIAATYSKSMSFAATAKGLEGKASTPPGLWRDLRFAKGKALREAQRDMKIYNGRDVDQTLELFEDMRPWLNGLNLGLFTDDDEPQCPNCESKNIHYRGLTSGTSYRYPRFRCTECGKWGRDTRSESRVNVVGI